MGASCGTHDSVPSQDTVSERFGSLQVPSRHSDRGVRQGHMLRVPCGHLHSRPGRSDSVHVLFTRVLQSSPCHSAVQGEGWVQLPRSIRHVTTSTVHDSCSTHSAPDACFVRSVGACQPDATLTCLNQCWSCRSHALPVPSNPTPARHFALHARETPMLALGLQPAHSATPPTSHVPMLALTRVPACRKVRRGFHWDVQKPAVDQKPAVERGGLLLGGFQPY